MRSAIALKQNFESRTTFAQTIARRVDAWRVHRMQKRKILQLRNLNDHTLKDIGVPRSGIVSVVNAQSADRS